jgi:hypothetical protein
MSREGADGVRKSIKPPGILPTAWLIAHRAAMESLRDRSTLVLSVLFAVAVPTFFALGLIRTAALQADSLK